MPHPFTILLGKAVRHAARLRGGGSALPGLFVEKISPDFIPSILSQLPKGVVVISGTNGKTTTTKMVVSLLESQGLKVFTNRTGSNFTRGVAAALLGEIDTRGKLSADIAVLELDEAHAVKFVQIVKPRYSLLLNVMRDQLDRFGEIDTTAKMLQKIGEATTDSVILNREDPRVASLATHLATQNIAYFGLDSSLLSHFPTDDQLHNKQAATASKLPAAATLTEYGEDEAVFKIGKKSYATPLKVRGAYNVYNGAAALALVQTILPEAPAESLVTALADVTPAFGRGEVLTINGQPLELVLVKNPSGFQLSLESFSPKGHATMIAVNDNYADGRDMSWLWDVDFTSLKIDGVAAVSGVRAFDMALRLQYDEIAIGHVETSLVDSLKKLITAHPDMPKRIFCTYTAMLALRQELSKMTNVEVIS